MILLLATIHLNTISMTEMTKAEKKFKTCKKIYNTSNNLLPLIIYAPKKGKIFVISADIIRGDTVLEGQSLNNLHAV